MATQRVCSIPGCSKRHLARGWCANHYQKWYQHGTPSGAPENKNKPLRWLQEHVTYLGEDCLPYPFGKTGMGYGVVYPKGEQQVMAHRWMCEQAHGPAPEGKIWVAHSCANGHNACVNPNHLRWATPKENGEDRLAHGNCPQGPTHPNTKLTADQVRQIRAMKGRASRFEVAAMFNVTDGAISGIWQGRTWKWLDI